MWVDPMGVLHTEPLPDAVALLPPRLPGALAALGPAQLHEFTRRLDALRDEVHAEVEEWSRQEEERPYRGVSVDPALVRSLPADPVRLLSALAATPGRWRIDLVEIVAACVGSLLGEG